MNGCFEDENICIKYEKNCAPEGWISTSLYADYSFDDKPQAFEGRYFVGLTLADKKMPSLATFFTTGCFAACAEAHNSFVCLFTHGIDR